MGVIKFFSSSSNDKPNKGRYDTLPAGNPNPYNFVIQKSEDINGICVLKVRYPDAKNYEGNKIILFEKKSSFFLKRKSLDPHFSKKGPSPIARFEPTKRGWEMAIMFARMWGRSNTISSIIS